MNELDKKYNNYLKINKEFFKTENELIKELEIKINNELNKRINEKNNKYNIYYNILNDLLNYIIECKTIYNYEYENFNLFFNKLELNLVYIDINFKEYLKEKYNTEFIYNILKNNDLYFIVYDLIKTDNKELFKELMDLKINELDKYIFSIFEFILLDIINNIPLCNTYLEFLRMLLDNNLNLEYLMTI